MTRVTGRRAAESAADAEFEDWPDEDWPEADWPDKRRPHEIEASNKHNTAGFRKRMAPPFELGGRSSQIERRTQRFLRAGAALQRFRHPSGGLWSRGCKYRVLRWLGPQSEPQRDVRPNLQAFLSRRVSQIRNMAPMIATTIVPIKPPAWMPSAPRSQPPTTAPTMPRIISATVP